jgi:hypothetical protein
MTNARPRARWIAGGAGRGAVGAPFRGVSTALDKVRRLRHRRGPRLRLLGLGRRALLHLVGHRPAADDRHRARNFAASSPAATRWTGISAKRRSRENLPMLLGLSASGTATSAASVARRHPLRPAPVALSGLSAAARHGIERQARDARRQRRSRVRPGPSSGASPAPTASTPSSSSSTRARRHPGRVPDRGGTGTSPAWAPPRPADRQLPRAVGGADEGPHAGGRRRRSLWPRAGAEGSQRWRSRRTASSPATGRR